MAAKPGASSLRCTSRIAMPRTVLWRSTVPSAARAVAPASLLLAAINIFVYHGDMVVTCVVLPLTRHLGNRPSRVDDANADPAPATTGRSERNGEANVFYLPVGPS